jgi:hypothetical protein
MSRIVLLVSKIVSFYRIADFFYLKINKLEIRKEGTKIAIIYL